MLTRIPFCFVIFVLLVGCNNSTETGTSENRIENDPVKKEELTGPPRIKSAGTFDGGNAKSEKNATPPSDSQTAPAFGSEKNYESKTCGMKFVRIEPGKFVMGADKVAFSYLKDAPQHEVEITKPFYLGVTEVTRTQWKMVKGTEPWNRYVLESFIEARKVEDQSRWPAIKITWNNAKSFLKELSKKDGRRYRLPTEAEWEYACRAGTTTRYFCGENAEDLYDYAWMEGNSKALTTIDGDYRCREHSVGLLKPNPWGLYDMCGNVDEWCEGGAVSLRRDYAAIFAVKSGFLA